MLKLTINMQLHQKHGVDIFQQQRFAEWLLQVGENRVEPASDNIQLPVDVVLRSSKVEDLVSFIYPQLVDHLHDGGYFLE